MNHVFDTDTLSIYNEQLNGFGDYIFEKRKSFIETFIPIFNAHHQAITGSQETVQLVYESHLFENDLVTLLQENLNKDRALHYTSMGIHKDDLSFEIDNYPIKKFGSQGQQKSFLIALKLAQFEFLKTQSGQKPILLLNGKSLPYKIVEGYVVVESEWKDNDVIEYKLPMEVKKVVSRPELTFNNGRVALQRGPIVYCIEGADNQNKAWNIISPNNATFTTEDFTVLDEKVVSLVANLPSIQIEDNGASAKTINQKVRAIPYYTWCNRGSNAMQVWLPTSFKDVKVNY